MTSTEVPRLDIAAAAAMIAGDMDSATSALTDMVLHVSMYCASAAEQGLLIDEVAKGLGNVLKDIRNALVAPTIDEENPSGRPGIYAGYTLVPVEPRRKIDYDKLAELHPDVYAELVTEGKPSVRLSYTRS